MEFMYLSMDDLPALFTVLGIAFGGGFTVTVALHYIGYAVFGLLSLLNIGRK